MEKSVNLKTPKGKGKRHKKVNAGIICVIHYESTKDDKVIPLTEHSINIIKETASARLKLSDRKHRLEEIIQNIPDELEVERHGSHTRCYKLFTNISKIKKRDITLTCETDEQNVASCSKRRRSSTEFFCSTVLFPVDKCLFCDKAYIKVKGVQDKNLVKCMTKCAEESIKAAAVEKMDSDFLTKIQDHDLIAREARYHQHCRRNYTRSKRRNLNTDKNLEATASQHAHAEAFTYICQYVEDRIITGQNVERLTLLRERYLTYLQEKYPNEYNANYKTYKLKDKLIKHFNNRIRFWQPSYRSELVYAADIESQAVETAFELATSYEKRLQEAALILRRCIFEAKSQSSAMPWPPSSSWLLSQRKPPEVVKNFYKYVISGKSDKVSCKTDRIATSLAEDVCYAVSNGKWEMPKHILLPMTVRHLTGSAEVITILNRYGHGQSYTRTLELETAICNKVTASETVLPPNISTNNNAVLHMCWDNFDLNEETPSGSGTTHSTHGIAIQELLNESIPTYESGSQVIAKNRERTVKPKEVELKPCYAKVKTEPTIEVNVFKPEYNFTVNDLREFTWFFCREIGSTFDVQSVPPWSGWISKTADEPTSGQSIVEYMAPLNHSINDNATVQHILQTSVDASNEVGQKYTIVTCDLAVAKKAYSLVWQSRDELGNVIVRMGVFHTICSIFGTVGKLMKGSGLAELVIESGICASGSLEKVLSGKHYNRALNVHKTVMEALERLLLRKFEEAEPRKEYISDDTSLILQKLAESPCKEKMFEVNNSPDFEEYFNRYQQFKSEIRKGESGKTAQFWLMYVDIIHMVLMLIKATKINDLDLHIASLYKLCSLFFAFDHNNYARYVPVYLLTLMNIDPGAEELLRSNGFSVSRSSVPASRNAVDITIEQTINRHAKSDGGIIGFSRNYAAYYRWCMTRHCRARYVEATLQNADIIREDFSEHKEVQPAQIRRSEEEVNNVMTAIESFMNPFQTENNKDELYCVSSGIPAKAEVAHDLLKATEIGEKTMDEFIKRRLIEKSVPFHDPIKRSKLKTFATAEVTRKVTNSQNKISQIKAERNVFAQLVLLAVQHDIDLELTLSFPLGPVPWPLATADGMPVKTDKSKLLHYVESSIAPTTSRPKDDVVFVFDGNALLQSLVTIPATFQDVAETVFSQLPKAARVDFVTDTYSSQSIKAYERRRRGSAPKFLLSGAKTKTPRDWKAFMSNSENKTQLINLIFEQWISDSYAQKLKGRELYFVNGEKCYLLTSADGNKVQVRPYVPLYSTQEEADTRIILHCLDICTASTTQKTTIIVRSPDTDVFVLLVKYSSKIRNTVLFDTGTGNKRRLLNVHNIFKSKGEIICSVLPAIHCLTGCDTTSAFVRRGKVTPLKLVEKNEEYIAILAEVGLMHNCSDDLFNGIEKIVCAIYGHKEYNDINKLRYDMFLEKYQVRAGNVLSTDNGMDMSLLPPCQSSLKMHIKRVNYQVFIWIHAHENYPILPKVDESGWKFGSDNLLEYDWCSDNIVPQELAEIICDTPATCDNDDTDDDYEDVEMTNIIDTIYETDSDYEDLGD